MLGCFTAVWAFTQLVHAQDESSQTSALAATDPDGSTSEFSICVMAGGSCLYLPLVEK
jgi:hypothetical protein